MGYIRFIFFFFTDNNEHLRSICEYLDFRIFVETDMNIYLRIHAGFFFFSDINEHLRVSVCEVSVNILISGYLWSRTCAYICG